MSGAAGRGDLAVYERSVPGAPLVVFVHGAMDRGATFARATRHLRDLSTLRYDRSGYGRSAGLPPRTTFTEHVDDLLEVVGGRPCVLVGHSMGGLLALGAAARRPEQVTAVAAYESPLVWAEWWPADSAGNHALAAGDSDPGEAAERFVRRLIGDDRWARLPPSTRDARRQEGAALVADLASIRQDPAPLCPEDVRVPVVAAYGSESIERHRRSAAELAASVSDGELVVIEGAGHTAQLSHSGDFASFVRRAVARVQ